MSRFGFGLHLKCRSLTEGAFTIVLTHKDTGTTSNLADTGFGLSQVLPLIVQGYYASKNSLIIAEQPEIHLNPKLQSLLADLFVAIAERRVGVLVETHSEHLLLRLR
ncbi:MAG: AAA family ATPase, partial [Acidobacteria bacterium]|nr:AAA family ATPase [Acidobacteriota bacterium]